MRLVQAVVMFRGLAAPKRRLAPVLSLPERRALALAMLADVFTALQQAEGLSAIAMMSPVLAIRRLAREHGVRFMLQQGRDLVQASTQAATVAELEGATGLLLLPADLPLLTATEVERLIAEAARAPLVIAPARDGQGTNALLTGLPSALSFQYGPDSYRLHLEAAQRVGLRTATVALPNLAFDVDEPADLAHLLSHPFLDPGSFTGRYVECSGLRGRLATGRLRRPEG